MRHIAPSPKIDRDRAEYRDRRDIQLSMRTIIQPTVSSNKHCCLYIPQYTMRNSSLKFDLIWHLISGGFETFLVRMVSHQVQGVYRFTAFFASNMYFLAYSGSEPFDYWGEPELALHLASCRLPPSMLAWLIVQSGHLLKMFIEYN